MNDVEQLPGGGFRIAGTRVSLDSVAYAWRSGESPEGFVESFPSLSLVQVLRAIEYYQTHKKAVDEHLEAGEAESTRLREESRQTNPALHEKLETAKRETLSRPR